MNNSSGFNPKPYCSLTNLYIVTIARSHEYEAFLLVFIVINGVMALLSSCINLIIIFTIAQTATLRTAPSNVLILGLAISDLVSAAFAQSLYCVFRYSELVRSVELFCELNLVYNSALTFSIPMTILLLTAITTDRFLALRLHLRYNTIVTEKRMALVVVFIFLFCCGFSASRPFIDKWLIGVATLAIFLLLILLFLNGYFFFAISRVIHRHSSQIHAQQPSINMPRYKKSVNTMYNIVGAFVLCYVPFLVGLVTFAVFKQTEGILGFRVITITCLFMNGLVNPIIYFRRKRDLRNAAGQIIRGLQCRSTQDNIH